MRHQVAYFHILNKRQALPTYTLPALTGKIYILTSPELLQSAYRVKERLTFEPFIVRVGKHLVGLRPEVMNVWGYHPQDNKAPSLIRNTTMVFTKQIITCSQLQQMNAAALSKFTTILESIQDVKEHSMFIFLRNTYTRATSYALFGLHDPYEVKPSLVNTQWDFETGLLLIFVGFFPSIFVPKAYKA